MSSWFRRGGSSNSPDGRAAGGQSEMTIRRSVRQAGTALALGALALSSPALAQQQPAPSQSFGLTTGLVWNDNRGLDRPSQGDTTELFTRLDFGLIFSTPLQSLTLNGNVTLRGLDGAEENSIPDGLAEPNLRLRYNRAVRDAQLTITAFGQESETNTLVEEFNGADLTSINETATRLSYGFDAALELRRQDPFGVTFTTGFTGLRYSDTTSTNLLDQDRYRFGVNFRFNITPALQANLRTRYSTFDEAESAEGVRETYALDADITQNLPDGSFGLVGGITSVEEGERYLLGLQRSIERELWQVDGAFGIEQGVDGDTFPYATLNVDYDLPRGSLALDLEHRLRSGLEDDEREITSIRFNYVQNLTPVSTFNVNLGYNETNPTGIGGTTSLGTIGLSYRRDLAPGWQMDAGVNRRVSTNSSGVTATDNRFSLSLRRELSARR